MRRPFDSLISINVLERDDNSSDHDRSVRVADLSGPAGAFRRNSKTQQVRLPAAPI